MALHLEYHVIQGQKDQQLDISWENANTPARLRKTLDIFFFLSKENKVKKKKKKTERSPFKTVVYNRSVFRSRQAVYTEVGSVGIHCLIQ